MAVARRQSWFSFSMRGMLAALTLAALALGLWCGWVHPYRQQARAAARFRELGAVVKTEDGSFAWARWLFGRERFQKVVSIDFTSWADDSDSEPTIEFYSAQNVDSGLMAHVMMKLFEDVAPQVRFTEEARANRVIVQATPAQHIQIRALVALLEGRKTKPDEICQQDAALLAHCRELKFFIAPNSTFDDAALARMTCHESLTKLDLSRSRLTDRGLALLGKFPNLKILRLEMCPITDDGLRSLAACSQLETLDLSHTPITDRGVEHLVDLLELKSLDLTGTQITAKSLATIDRFPAAKIEVVVDDTRIPEKLTANNPRVRSRFPDELMQELRNRNGRGAGYLQRE